LEHIEDDGDPLKGKGADKITCIASTFYTFPTRVWHSTVLVINRQLWAISSNQFSPAPNPHRGLIDRPLSVLEGVPQSHQISPPYSSTAFASPPFPSRLWISIPMASNHRRTQPETNRTERSRRQVMRIDVLPDDVLLEIFHFHVNMSPSHEGKMRVEVWQSLVHVCRRWRSLVFRSPRRLNLRLFLYTQNTRKRHTGRLASLASHH